MGPEHALEAAKRSLVYKPDICITTGLAASSKRVRPGDIVAARLVSEVGEPVAVASHRELLSSAVDAGRGKLATPLTSICRTISSGATHKARFV